MKRKVRINLVPPELRPQFKVEPTLIPYSLAAVFVVFAATSALSFHFSIAAKRTTLAKVASENALLTQQIAAMEALKKQEDLESGKVKSLQDVIGRKNYWSNIFKELSIVTPKDVWLTVLGTTGGDDVPKKLMLKGEATSQKKMAQFFAALEKSRFFSGATINSSEKDLKAAPDLFRFEFTIPFPDANGGES